MEIASGLPSSFYSPAPAYFFCVFLGVVFAFLIHP
jgi:hypothetical protein